MKTFTEIFDLVNGYFYTHNDELSKFLTTTLGCTNMNQLVFADMLTSLSDEESGYIFLCPKSDKQRKQWDKEEGYDWGKVLIQPNFCNKSISMTKLQAKKMMKDLKLDKDYYLDIITNK